MSTLDSWIDRDELAALVAELSPAPEPVAEVAMETGIAVPDGDNDVAPQEAAFDSPEEVAFEAPEEAAFEVPEEVAFEAPEETSFDSPVASLPEDPFAPVAYHGEAEPIMPSPQEIAWETTAPEVPVADPVEEPFQAESHGEPVYENYQQAVPPEPRTEVPEVEPPTGVMDEAPVEAHPASWDFDTPEAYAASPFPAPESTNPDSPVVPLRRAAATQASEALERARNRAQLGGLLKNFSPPADILPVEEATEPELESGFEACPAILNEPPAAEAGTTTEEPAPEPPAEEIEQPGCLEIGETISLDDLPDPDAEPEYPSSPDSASESQEPTPADGGEPSSGVDPVDDFASAIEESPALPLRERLRGFAGRASLATGSVDVAITDFQSYPLLPGTDAASAPHSALRLAHWFGSLAQDLKASRDGVSQIALGGGDWLCVVAAESAAGGVCASFRVGNPLSSEQARLLTDDLRSTLREPASLASAV